MPAIFSGPFQLGTTDTVIYTAPAPAFVFLTITNEPGEKVYVYTLRPNVPAPMSTNVISGGNVYPAGARAFSQDNLLYLTLAAGDSLHAVTEKGLALGSISVLSL